MSLVAWHEVAWQLLNRRSLLVNHLAHTLEVGAHVEGLQVFADGRSLLPSATGTVEAEELFALDLSIPVAVVGLEEGCDPLVAGCRQVSAAGLDKVSCTIPSEGPFRVAEPVVPPAEDPPGWGRELTVRAYQGSVRDIFIESQLLRCKDLATCQAKGRDSLAVVNVFQFCCGLARA